MACLPSKDEELESNSFLKELCLTNGISSLYEGENTQELELFFTDLPSVPPNSMVHFPNLQKLAFLGQSFTEIPNLSSCVLLTELWVSECKLQEITDVGYLLNLSKLYLYSNKIKKMRNLNNLKNLETLWLNCNQIDTIEGLEHLKFLTEVNLAENKISKIGTVFNPNIALEKLELSGNHICSFKELLSLQSMPSLRELGLASPEYPPCPVGRLCNYSTQVLYLLPNLSTIDNVSVSQRQIKDAAVLTVNKKRIFYNMRGKTIWRNYNEMELGLRVVCEKTFSDPRARIRKLAVTLKQLEREVRENKENAAEDEQGKKQPSMYMVEVDEKKAALKERIELYKEKMAKVQEFAQAGYQQLKNRAHIDIAHLRLELESGGNIRLEEGSQTDKWFTPAHDLVVSRFCSTDYRSYGVTGLKVQRILRIHHRYMMSRFALSMEQKTEKNTNNQPTKTAGIRRFVEYLFWVWDPDVEKSAKTDETAYWAESQDGLSEIIQEGFKDGQAYKDLGKEAAAVHLGNSMFLAERLRMDHAIEAHKEKPGLDDCPFRHGRLVICKAFVGNSQAYSKDKLIEEQHYRGFHSVFRPSKDNRKEGDTSPATADSFNVNCDCSRQHCDWFIFDHTLVLPEYIVEFEYITKPPVKSLFLSHEETLKAVQTKYKDFPMTENIPADDNDVLHMPPTLKARPRLAQLNDEVLCSCARSPSVNSITVLDLTSCGLVRVRQLQQLPQLSHLYLAFNELQRLDDIAHMNLELLDASFNKIITLEGLKSMHKLKQLDLQWNKLKNTREDISILRKHCPVLLSLDLRHNNWQKEDGIRLRALGRIKSLKEMNGESVKEDETAIAMKLAAGSRVSQPILMTEGCIDLEPPRTLSLLPVAQIMSLYGRSKPEQVLIADPAWYLTITSINLDCHHISKLSNLEMLENLKYASFNDNDLTKIEGLDGCVNIEELSLENNCITRLENISHLTKLKRLQISCNYISSFEGSGIERLVSLEYLCMESNTLSSLMGLQKSDKLVEIYLANNHINNMRDVFYLKTISSLLILDLHGNPVVALSEDFRPFFHFHLKNLKALNGIPLDPAELAQAREQYGGRLTEDFVVEKHGHANFKAVREMDFAGMSLRSVDLGKNDAFLNLVSLNLENNNLNSFSGLIHLTNLKILCLNNNRIESIIPRPKNQPAQPRGPRSIYSQNPMPAAPTYSGPEFYTPVLENLEVLHLGYNGIKELAPLQLGRLPSLRALFLQGNELMQIDGLDGLTELRELVLDRNKIRQATPQSFLTLFSLTELHLEENRLRELTHFNNLGSIQRLYLAQNRIQDLFEIEKLESAKNLIEISLLGNMIAKRLQHRPILIWHLPSILVIDGMPVTDEERLKTEIFYAEQQELTGSISGIYTRMFDWQRRLNSPTGENRPSQAVTAAQHHAMREEQSLPGLSGGGGVTYTRSSHMPVRVTNMQLQSSSRSGLMGVSLQPVPDQESLARGGGRRRGAMGRMLDPMQQGRQPPASGNNHHIQDPRRGPRR